MKAKSTLCVILLLAIIFPASAADVPVKMVLTIDVSGSMSGEKIEKAKDGAIKFLDVLVQYDSGKDDEVALVSFSNDVHVLSDLTNDFDYLKYLISNMYATDLTSMWDAVYYSVDLLKNEPSEAKAVLLLTDGQDNDSEHTKEEAIQHAKNNKVRVFVIGIGADVNDDDLRELAEETGGSYWHISVANLVDIYEMIALKMSLIFPPDAEITYSPQHPKVGEVVTFDASQSSSPKGIIAYHWWFSDGTTAQGVKVTHVFKKPGNHTVVLTVYDSDYIPDSEIITVNVTPVENEPPIADFECKVFMEEQGVTLICNASSSYDPDGGSITNYEWDLNSDGQIDGRGKIIQATVKEEEVWDVDDVKLIVTDDEGTKSSSTSPIYVIIGYGYKPHNGVEPIYNYESVVDLGELYVPSSTEMMLILSVKPSIPSGDVKKIRIDSKEYKFEANPSLILLKSIDPLTEGKHSLSITIGNEELNIKLIAYKTAGFVITYDGYNFENPAADELTPLEVIDYLKRLGIYARLSNIERLAVSILWPKIGLRGNCYGMSTTASHFFDGTLTPPKKPVYNLSRQEVLDYIQRYQVEQLFEPGLRNITKLDPNKEIQDVFYYIDNHVVPVLAYDEHAVNIVGYYQEGNSLKLIVYDNNHPGDQTIWEFEDGVLYVTTTSRGYYSNFVVLKPKVYLSDYLEEFVKELKELISWFFQELVKNGKKIISFHCPIDIIVEDEFRRKIVIINGNVESNEIPGAEVFTYGSNYTLILPDNLTYSVELIGKDEGDVYAFAVSNDKGDVVLEEFEFDVTSSSKAFITSSPSSRIGTIELDENGDGVPEKALKPSNVTKIGQEDKSLQQLEEKILQLIMQYLQNPTKELKNQILQLIIEYVKLSK